MKFRHTRVSMASLTRSCFLLAVLSLSILVTGCDNPQSTIDGLRKEIAEFKAKPTPERQSQIDARFVELEQQIAKVDAEDPTKADSLKKQYAGLQGEFQAAKLSKSLNDAANAIQGIGEAVKQGAKSIGETFQNSDSNSSN